LTGVFRPTFVDETYVTRNQKMTIGRNAACAAIVCLSATISGCGGAYDAAASGIVTLDGQVVPRGTVSFNPVSGGPAAYAVIGEDGSYTVQTGREFGLPPGEYRVTVIANEAAAAAQSASGGPPPGGKAITPEWYRSAETSGLQFKVEPGDNELNLELTTQPPAGWKARGRM
jgi:hypothetical protein